MEIKIQCGCGTRFAFEVEPVNGRMPVRVKCPGCDADATDLANEAIRQEYGASAAPIPLPVPIPPSARVAVPQPMAVPAASAADVPGAAIFCPRHPNNPASETCRVCGKPICNECMGIHGYACSTYCRKRAEETGLELPVYTKQRAVVEARVARAATLILWVAMVLGVVVVGAWIWYTFWASHPRVIYSENLPHGDRARYYQFLGPDQMLCIKANQMSLFDVAQHKPLWSIPLDLDFSRLPQSNPYLAEAIPNEEEQIGLYFRAHVIATTNDLWVLFPGRLAQYDRRSGNRKQEIPLNPPFYGLAESDQRITVVSAGESGRRIVTRVQFADNTVQTEPLEPAAAPLRGRTVHRRFVHQSSADNAPLARLANAGKLANLARGKPPDRWSRQTGTTNSSPTETGSCR